MTACTVCSWSLAARAEGNCGPNISGKDTIPFEYTILFRSTLSAVPVEPAVDHDSTISCACAEVVITEATSMKIIEKLRMFDFMFCLLFEWCLIFSANLCASAVNRLSANITAEAQRNAEIRREEIPDRRNPIRVLLNAVQSSYTTYMAMGPLFVSKQLRRKKIEG